MSSRPKNPSGPPMSLGNMRHGRDQGKSASRTRPPISEKLLAEIEQELGLARPNKSVRRRLVGLVEKYVESREEPDNERLIKAMVRKRLKAVKKAASRLRDLL